VIAAGEKTEYSSKELTQLYFKANMMASSGITFEDESEEADQIDEEKKSFSSNVEKFKKIVDQLQEIQEKL